MERIGRFISRHRLHFLLLAGGMVLSYFLLAHNLSSLTNGQYTASELHTKQVSTSMRSIIENPVNAPYKVLVWAGMKLGVDSLLVTRLVSVLFALPIIGVFYLVAKHWYAPRIAVIGTMLFATSGGFLHFARYGTPEILQMAPLVLLAGLLLLRATPQRYRMLYMFAFTALVCISLYIPGVVWLGLVGVLLLKNRIVAVIRSLGIWRGALVPLLALIILAPLVYSITKDFALLKQFAGLPDQIPTLASIGDEVRHLGASLVYRGYWPADYWLVGAPLLNIGEIALFVAGAWFLLRRPMIRGNYYLIIALAVSSVFIVLQGSIGIAVLIPLLYLVITGGLHLLVDDWMKVFPRNPFANALSMVLVSLLAGFSVLYHTRAYYLAWPGAPETKGAYTIRQDA